MKSKFFAAAMVASLSVIGWGQGANAVTVTFTNQANFLAGLTTSVTENFEGFAVGTAINSLTNINSVTTDGTAGSTQAEIGSIAGLPFPMTAGLPTSSGDRFLSSELADPIFAGAGLIFNLDMGYDGVGFFVVDGAPLGNFVIDLFSGATNVGQAVFGPQTLPNSFVGVTSTVAFDRFEIDSVAGDSWGIDDLTIGTVAVPEPGMLAIFGLGLVGLGFARRKKQTA